MGITHLKDGQGFFDGDHAASHRDFDFSGSVPAPSRVGFANGGSVGKAKPPFAAQTRAGDVEQRHDSSELAHRMRKANGGGVQVPTDAPFPVDPTSMPRQMQADGTAGVKMAQGGRAKLPRAMKAKALQSHSPINTPPRNPTTTRTPRNIMPGGAMAYGVQPSSEPDRAGSEQGIPQLKDGGKVRMGALRGTY